MVALGIITLFLTGFAIIYYSYLSNHSERDVSFFLSVSLIAMLMNLCTNAGGVFGLSYVYLVIAVVFIGVGFAVDTTETIGFYTSIGPWFKTTFTNTAHIGWQVLSLIVFPAGIALYFVWYQTKPELARLCGRSALFGILLWILLLWTILGLAL